MFVILEKKYYKMNVITIFNVELLFFIIIPLIHTMHITLKSLYFTYDLENTPIINKII